MSYVSHSYARSMLLQRENNLLFRKPFFILAILVDAPHYTTFSQQAFVPNLEKQVNIAQ
jgi:hypothetical protein